MGTGLLLVSWPGAWEGGLGEVAFWRVDRGLPLNAPPNLGYPLGIKKLGFLVLGGLFFVFLFCVS